MIVMKLDSARLLLAEARDAGDAKKVADMARAAEVYARRQKLSEEAINYANAVKVDAMTMLGEFLKETPKNTGRPGPGRGKSGVKPGTAGVPGFTKPEIVIPGEPTDAEPPTLAEIGISKNESSAAQALADLKKTDPKLHEQVRDGKTTVTAARREAGKGKGKKPGKPPAPKPPDTPKAETNGKPEEPTADEETPSPLVDKNGEPWPAIALPSIAGIPAYEALIREFSKLSSAVQKMKDEQPIGIRFDVTGVRNHLKRAQGGLQVARPHAVCPYCGGTGYTKKDDGVKCPACRCSGWVDKTTYENSPKANKV